jgi:hypothetical protein
VKLRLFGLRRHDSKDQTGQHFSDLMLARKERDRLTAINNVQYAVCPGPDHKKHPQWLIEIEREFKEESVT